MQAAKEILKILSSFQERQNFLILILFHTFNPSTWKAEAEGAI